MKKSFLPAFLWLLLITGVSVMPGIQVPKFSLIGADKLGHAFVYGVLTVLILRACQLRNRPPGRVTGKQTAGTLVFAIGYGVGMEFVQYAFLPGRFYEYDDMLANAIGAFTGWLVFYLYTHKKTQSAWL